MTLENVEKILIKDERTPWLHIHSAYDEMPLTIEAFRVLCHFARRANNETKETKTTYKNIGEVCFKATYPNSAPNTLRRRAIKAVSELEGFGLVRKEPWYTEGGDLLGNIFILTHTTSWKLDFDPSVTNNSLVRGVAGDTSDADSTSATDDTEGCYQLHQEVMQDSPRGDAGRTEYKGNPLRESKKVILEGNPTSCAERENDNLSQKDDKQVVGQTQTDQKKGIASHSKTLKSQHEKEFEELVWPIAYNKKAKAKAMSSYCTVRKEVMKTDEQRDDLLEAWRYVNEVVYPAKHKKDGTKQFIPMPTTWFNQHRWNDEDIQEGIHNRFITGDSTPPIDINSLSKEQKADYERKSNLMAFYAKQQQKNGGTAA